MSFSLDVKEEIAKQISNMRHCQLAELATIISYCGSLTKTSEGADALLLSMEREPLYRKCFTLLKKTYNISDVFVNGYEQNGRYEICISDADTVWDIFKSVGIVDKSGTFRGFGQRIDARLIKNFCCRRAFLKGAFMCIGSMSDPSKGYHLELVCENESQAQQIQEVLTTFEIEAKIICRKKYFVVYIKEGSAIVDFLGICEASVALMEFENHRIYKEMSNSINRQVNCETANIAKTVKAANRQVEDIILIQKVYGFEKLPEGLREMAQIRLEHPEATLQELGDMLSPPMGKSGVNHRLRKLCEIAEELR